ncbi:ABC transporter permease [Clostridium cylindrosporum]|uniref:Putative aliphatic sulfonates transport permease protein SsuC n=1 Tax=Clostridium cylindrosporum DSM 605 TaxID=1121307 RepID=A0A0J8D913_CLOCY|nr:ABC transporter permease [Clostridium cylindrosporum]KMT22367.1 putative aliphatic sulfonates transport permease protein SsuC [Clostridium cylindrosporum DSM 605]
MGEIITGTKKPDKKQINKVKAPKSKKDINKGIINLGIVTPLVIILLWEAFSRLGYIKPLILPSPKDIFITFISLVKSGELLTHMSISLFRVVQGFFIGALLGVIVGTLMALFKKVNEALSSTLSFLRPIPIIAWMPVLILWMGIEEGSKVSVIAIGTFWPVLINVIHGIKSVDIKYLEVAKVLEKSKKETLFKVVFPAALPAIFTGIKIGVSTAWMCVVAAELISSASGIGYKIMYSREILQPADMFVGVFSIGVVGILVDKGIKLVEAKTLKWNVNIKN